MPTNTSYRWKRVLVPIKWMPTHHTQLTGERMSERDIEAHQLYVLTTQQLTCGSRREDIRRPIKCIASPHTSYRWRRGRERHRAKKCMRSPHTSYRWRGEVIVPIKCMRSPHNQLQVEKERESIDPIKWMRSPHSSYRWRGGES